MLLETSFIQLNIQTVFILDLRFNTINSYNCAKQKLISMKKDIALMSKNINPNT